MNKNDLRDVLTREGFDPRGYSLGHENGDEVLCLRFEDGVWSVYYSERGLRAGEKTFVEESAACEFFLSELRSDPTTRIGWRSGFSM